VWLGCHAADDQPEQEAVMMNEIRAAGERLELADDLPDVLAAAHAAFSGMLPVIYEQQDRGGGAYAAFVLAGVAAANGRMAIWSAPSLSRQAAADVAAAGADGGVLDHEVTAVDAAPALARLAGLLATRLTDAAEWTASADDQAACADAARHARDIYSRLGGGGP
jgi:hypothetical protein